VTTISKALQILETFAEKIENFYPEPVLDYRGREISAESVLDYLDSEKYRFAEIASLLPEPSNPPTRILDIGMAYGFLPVLLKNVSSWQCEGVDVPENITAYCRFAQHHGIPVHGGTLGTTPLPFAKESFRGIIFSEVLEHLRLSPSLVFQELHRILVPQGILLVTTPNIARLTNIVKLLLGKNIVEEFPDNVASNNITEHLTHIREYTMSELVSLLEKNGFRQIKIHYSTCMERERGHRFITQFVPRWRGNLMVLAQKIS
jgi:2-polyprenyl-3-methyl-5-hydroxy-6-metoxy-1,4-benzoquinol methylase